MLKYIPLIPRFLEINPLPSISKYLGYNPLGIKINFPYLSDGWTERGNISWVAIRAQCNLNDLLCEGDKGHFKILNHSKPFFTPVNATPFDSAFNAELEVLKEKGLFDKLYIINDEKSKYLLISKPQISYTLVQNEGNYSLEPIKEESISLPKIDYTKKLGRPKKLSP